MNSKRIEIRSKVMNILIGVIVVEESGLYWESKNKSKIEQIPLNDLMKDISSILQKELIVNTN